jgi:hypothetical protein
MLVLVFSFLAILIFALLADRKRAREFFPVIITGIIIRFLEHYIMVDWLGLWTFRDSHLILPVTADLTLWPVAYYLFLQYMPCKSILSYITTWVVIMLTYLGSLKALGVISFQDIWIWAVLIFLLCTHFSLIAVIWKWLRNGINCLPERTP